MNLRKFIFVTLAALTAATAVAYGVFVSGQAGVAMPLLASTSVPYLGKAPDFTLTEKNGLVFSKSVLDGQIWVADFVFTRCQGQCPIMTQQMARLQEALPQVKLVSFSVDPDFDKPEALKAYAQAYKAENQRWYFLTGSRDVLNQVSTAFHMNKIDEPMFHSASFVLVDRRGDVRGYYDANDAQKIEQLISDAKRL